MRELVVARVRELLAAHAGGALVATIDGADSPALLAGIDTARALRPEVPVMLLCADHEGGKVAIVAACPKEWIARGLKAGDWVKAAAQACGGSGGGRPDSAQAGGKDPARAMSKRD